MQHHKYSLTELDNMMPWEREIYINLLVQFIEEENKEVIFFCMLLFGASFHRSLLCTIQKVVQFIEYEGGGQFYFRSRHS